MRSLGAGSSVRKYVIEAYSPFSGADRVVQLSALERPTTAPSPTCAVNTASPVAASITNVEAKARLGFARLSAATLRRSRARSTHDQMSSSVGRAAVLAKCRRRASVIVRQITEDPSP